MLRAAQTAVPSGTLCVMNRLHVVGLLAWGLGVFGAMAAELPRDRAGLLPDDVVELQLSALQSNDEQDTGIALTWEYTSPANQQVNGPFERFSQMIHQTYGDLLQSQDFVIGAANVEDGGASVPVRLTCAAGKTHGFIFWLSMEHPGDRDGHWLTEGVSPIPVPQEPASPARPPKPPAAPAI